MFTREESFVASFGIVVVAIVVVLMGVTSWWIVRSQQELMVSSRLDQVRQVAGLMSQSAEALMISDNLSPLRRLIVENSQKYELQVCRVVLPDGTIVADADPSRIATTPLPANWSGGEGITASEDHGAGRVAVRRPLAVAGRGEAVLEIVADVNGISFWDAWETLAGIGAIGSLAMVAMLLIYRRTRSRLRALGAIREALLMYKGEHTPAEFLKVSPDFGIEAQAWNEFLNETEKLRDQHKRDEVNDRLDSRQRGTRGLDDACDTMPYGLILVGKEIRVQYANGAAAAFVQADRQAMMGSPLDQFMTQTEVLDAVKTAATGTSRRRAVIVDEIETDSGYTVLRYIVRPVRRTDPGDAMVIIEDITQQRVAEKTRNEFVAQVAHELRTPLSNIRLYAESLLEDGDDTTLRAKAINVINIETKRLARLVSDMLSVAEIEAGSMKLSADDVQLGDIFHELQADYEQQADEKNIDLSFNLPPKVPVIHADRDKFLMALHNLVSNALKYTANDGRVSVELQVQPNQIVVEVADTGYGISEEDQQKIFERFYRARDERLASIPGTGLGLSLAREIVRLHGGDITLDSQVGQGSTFTLSLPHHVEAA